MTWRMNDLQRWVAGVGAALLAQGALSLLIDTAGIALPRLVQAFIGDPLHAVIHVIWGIVMLGCSAIGRSRETIALLSLVFGVFYVSLGFLGVLVHHPFGLLLGPGENVFHLVVGPASLVMGVRALKNQAHRAPTAPEASFTA
jgi:hypothetical protein